MLLTPTIPRLSPFFRRSRKNDECFDRSTIADGVEAVPPISSLVKWGQAPPRLVGTGTCRFLRLTRSLGGCLPRRPNPGRVAADRSGWRVPVPGLGADLGGSGSPPPLRLDSRRPRELSAAKAQTENGRGERGAISKQHSGGRTRETRGCSLMMKMFTPSRLQPPRLTPLRTTHSAIGYARAGRRCVGRLPPSCATARCRSAGRAVRRDTRVM